MAPVLLQTKLYIPQPRPNLLSRPSLIQRLDEGVRLGHRLTLVSAPPGFGKTTLVSDWLRHLSSRPSAASGRGIGWLSLDEADNDPLRFWSYVVAALETARPDLGQTALAMLRAPQPPPLRTCSPA